jgi:hypothetical protein
MTALTLQDAIVRAEAGRNRATELGMAMNTQPSLWVPDMAA